MRGTDETETLIAEHRLSDEDASLLREYEGIDIQLTAYEIQMSLSPATARMNFQPGEADDLRDRQRAIV
jgi:hypothetical protein